MTGFPTLVAPVHAFGFAPGSGTETGCASPAFTPPAHALAARSIGEMVASRSPLVPFPKQVLVVFEKHEPMKLARLDGICELRRMDFR